MEELKEVQSEKSGTVDDVKREFISATGEMKQSITAIKNQFPAINDDEVTKDGATKDDERKLKTLTKEPITDFTTDGTDSYDTEAPEVICEMEELKEVQADKKGTVDDVKREFISATGEMKQPITAIKEELPDLNDNKATRDGDTKDDETELRTATQEPITDFTSDDTDSYDTKVPRMNKDDICEMERLKEVKAEKRGTVDDAEGELISATAGLEQPKTEIKNEGPRLNDDIVTKDGDNKGDVTELKTELKTATQEPITDFTTDDTDSYDTKDEICRKVLQKCYTKLVSYMEPESLLDHFYEIGFLTHPALRDIRDIQSTTAKNRAIVDKVLTKGAQGYEDMKMCLQRSKQEGLVFHLDMIENELKLDSQSSDVSVVQSLGPLQTLEHEQHRQQQLEQPISQQARILRAMKTELLKSYRNSEFLSVTFFPLVETEDMKIDDLYVKPYMKHENKNVDSYQEIFKHNDQPNTNIYVVGDSGLGKTAFCQKMVSTWCRVHSGTFEKKSNDEEAMKQFDFLFYIALREAVEENDIEEMIKKQLLDEKYYGQVSEVLTNKKCLVILDGLDEWGRENKTAKFAYNKGLPGRKANENLTVLTTTRPWKLDAIQLKTTQIGARIELLGIKESSSKNLIQLMLTRLNQENKRHMKMEDFISKLAKNDLEHFMAIPVILKQLMCLWHSGRDMGQTKTVLYCQMTELLFDLAQIRFEKDPTYEKKKGKWINSAIQLPSCFNDKGACKEFKQLLFVLSRLAFYTALSKEKDSVLVFERSQTEIHGMTTSDINMCLIIGILSQRGIIKSCKSQRKLSFRHKSYQEFLAALFIALSPEECDQNMQTLQRNCNSLGKLMEIEPILTFIGGMCPSYTLCKLLRYVRSLKFTSHYFQNIIKNGLKEDWCCSHDNADLVTAAIEIQPHDEPEHIELMCQVNIHHFEELTIRTPPTSRCIEYLKQIHTLSKLVIEPFTTVSSRTSRYSNISKDIMDDLVPHMQNMLSILSQRQPPIEPSGFISAESCPFSEEHLNDIIQHNNNIIRILIQQRVVIDPSGSSYSSNEFFVNEDNRNNFRQSMQAKRNNINRQNLSWEPWSSTSSGSSALYERYIYPLIDSMQIAIDINTERQSLNQSESSYSIKRSSLISEDTMYVIIHNNSDTLTKLRIWCLTLRSRTKLFNLLHNLPHLNTLSMNNINLSQQLLESLQDLKTQRQNVYIIIKNSQILPDIECTE